MVCTHYRDTEFFLAHKHTHTKALSTFNLLLLYLGCAYKSELTNQCGCLYPLTDSSSSGQVHHLKSGAMAYELQR